MCQLLRSQSGGLTSAPLVAVDLACKSFQGLRDREKWQSVKALLMRQGYLKLSLARDEWFSRDHRARGLGAPVVKKLFSGVQLVLADATQAKELPSVRAFLSKGPSAHLLLVEDAQKLF